jgi:2-keto-4-pentenoate hydratase
MTPDAISRAARLLADARAANRPLALAHHAAEITPSTIDAAYALQRATMALLPGRIGGWKIGATAPAIMQRFGISEPFYGPIYAADVIQNPARVPVTRFAFRLIETEMALRMGRDLPAQATPWTRTEIVEAIDAVVPAFEIISPRFDKMPFEKIELGIADCGVNGGLVAGTPVTDWRGLDLPRVAARLLVDGVEKGAGTGADALGDPVNVAEWIANTLRVAGIGLERGQLLSTGTMTGIVGIEPGQTAVGDFGSLGRVQLTFA